MDQAAKSLKRILASTRKTMAHALCAVALDYKKRGPYVRCISPLKAGINKAGEIVYSSTKSSQELASFEFECRRCLPCRLNNAREKAIRSFHEAQIHDSNIFLTLTYNEENLKSPRLQYRDWQLFIKRLREKVTRNVTEKDAMDKLYIPYMVTGEYGDLTKRPHWHAILFNYEPADKEYKYTNELGDRVWTSETLTNLWKKGNVEYGSVTMESAGYVARYAAKKLVHGKDQDHNYDPIHKTSCRKAIGRQWIEKYYYHTFENGFIVLPNGQQMKIPRYYTDWLKKHKFDKYVEYVNGPRVKAINQAQKIARKEEIEFLSQIQNYKSGDRYPSTLLTIQERVLNSKFKRLNQELKL